MPRRSAPTSPSFLRTIGRWDVQVHSRIIHSTHKPRSRDCPDLYHLSRPWQEQDAFAQSAYHRRDAFTINYPGICFRNTRRKPTRVVLTSRRALRRFPGALLGALIDIEGQNTEGDKFCIVRMILILGNVLQKLYLKMEYILYFTIS